MTSKVQSAAGAQHSTQYSALVVGTDGSPSAASAVEVAILIAGKLGVPLKVVTAWSGDSDVPGSGDYAWARYVTTSAMQLARAAGIADVSTYEPNAQPAAALIEASSVDANTLAVAAHSGTRRRLFGSTATQLANDATSDVLFVRHNPNQWNRVALATDGSATSKRAVTQGLLLSNLLGAQVDLVTVAKDADEGRRLINAAATSIELEQPDQQFEQRILNSIKVARTLVEASSDYELLVIGNRGTSGVTRLLGSVARKVVQSAQSNVLLVNTSHAD